MKTANSALFPALVLLALLLLSGCTEITKAYVTDSYEKSFKPVNPNEPGYDPLKAHTLFDPANYADCKVGTCEAFMCQNRKTPLLALDVPRWGLSGGSCWFEPDFDKAKWDKVQAPNSPVAVRQFMIGQGASFEDFTEASRFCGGNSLDFSVKWLVAPDGGEYPLPLVSRASCFLDRSIIPMYILYSNGKAVSETQAAKIAGMFKGKGPVILVSEMDFDSTDPVIRSNVVRQVKAMKTACQDPVTKKSDCIIAFGVRMNDKDALKLLADTGNGYDDVFTKSVDLVAFSVNNHYSKQVCEPDPQATKAAPLIFSEAFLFVQSIRYDYDKSSIIPYMMFDRLDTAPIGPNLPCLWNERQVDEAHRYFFEKAMPVLAGMGVIGAAPYSYYKESNPLHCNDCGLYQVDPARQAYTDRFMNWFAFCNAYKISSSKSSGDLGAAGSLLSIYATQEGTICGFAQNNHAFYSRSIYQPASPYSYTSTVRIQRPAYEPTSSPSAFFACAACVNDAYPGQPFPFASVGSTPLPLALCKGDAVANGRTAQDIASAINAIDRFAGQRDLDPMLIRAMVDYESGYDHCSISKVDISAKCNKYNLDNIIPDDRNNPQNNWNPPAGIPPGTAEPAIFDPSLRCTVTPVLPGQKYCAYGLMQVSPDEIFYPGYVYDQLKQPYPDIINKCAQELGIADPKDLNPFDEATSLCLGTLEYQRHYSKEVSPKFTKSVRKFLDVDGTTHADANRLSILITYVTLHRYSKGGSDMVTWLIDDQAPNFADQKNLKAADCKAQNPQPICGKVDTWVQRGANRALCFGNSDFISFIDNCAKYDPKAPFASEVAKGTWKDYGTRVLSRYNYLTTNCANSVCPSLKQMYDIAIKERPQLVHLDQLPP